MSIASVLTGLGDAIRKKTGGTATLTLEQMTAGLNNIPDNDASDVTVSGATVSIPKGNYLADVSKSVTNQGTKTATLSTSTTSYTIPAGYHSGSGKVSISLEEKSATPSTSAQTITPTSGKVLSKVTVAAIPSTYVPSGYVKPTATKPATTYSPKTTAQTIAAGTYCSGAQTIAATTGTANTGHVLSGYTFNSGNGIGLTGTIPTLSTDATGSGEGVHHTSEYNPHYGVLSEDDTSKYVYTFVPPNNYIGNVNYIRVPESKVADAVGVDGSKILSGTSILGVAGTIASKAAATYGAKTSAQTIAAGQYLSGAQTIAAVTQTNLSAANILKGKTVTIASNGSNLWSVAGSAVPLTGATFKTQTDGGYQYLAATEASAIGAATVYSSNTSYVTLPAGTYRAFGFGLCDTTSGTLGFYIAKLNAVSSPIFSGEVAGLANEFFLNGTFTLSSSTTITLVMRSSNTSYGRRGAATVIRIS